MSEGGNDSSQEKTEEATPKRLEKAREEGQIPRSKELTTTALLLGGTIGLLIFGQGMVDVLMKIMSYTFTIERDAIFDVNIMIVKLTRAFGEAVWSLFPLFGLLLVASILGPIALGGWLLSAKSMAPKASRMNPIAGLKRMFSVKSLMELAKALAKVLVILSVAVGFLMLKQSEMLALSSEGTRPAIFHSIEMSVWAAIIFSAVTIVIALIDVPFQIWDHAKKLKMSRQDIKDEMKDSEGKPEVKGRVRQLQREMANRRMMGNVPDADVIITNPTHYAVALKYDLDNMDTPVLIAKGVDHVALKIREIASAHKIEIIESPQLARSIYHTTDIDTQIPSGLYVAVAQVLAYVFQLRNYRKGQGDRPVYPRRLKVPPDLRYD
ncbi:MAG: flagellar biosynthesis protein FlhB [Cellvibrionaceae bacterium]